MSAQTFIRSRKGSIMNSTVSTLGFSSNRGRYALDDAIYGRDLSSGRAIESLLGGRWIAGRVESALDICTSLAGKMFGSYYFIAGETGETCGLCAGMKVRLPRM